MPLRHARRAAPLALAALLTAPVDAKNAGLPGDPDGDTDDDGYLDGVDRYPLNTHRH